MRSDELLKAIGDIDERYILEAAGMKIKRRKRPLLALAACIVLALALTAAAFAANLFGLRDLLLPDTGTKVEAPGTGSGGEPYVPPVEEQADLVSLAGYTDSPEAKALAEWQSFTAGYDADGAILDSVGNGPTGLDSRYSLYGVYTQEMADKLDEIAGKYGLSLYREMDVITPEELAYRIGGDFMAENFVKYWPYIYDNGTFQFDGDAYIGGMGVGFQFRRFVKGTFDEVYLNIGTADEYTEWQYETAAGEDVLLALGDTKALIFGDFPECFISVNILMGTGEGLTEQGVEAFAEGIDFSMLKNVFPPEMRGDCAADGTLLPPEDAPSGADGEPGRAAAALDAYRQILRDALGDGSGKEFALADVNGDGETELVLVCGGEIYASNVGYVYGFNEDTGEAEELLSEFPLFTFYPGGYLEVGLSHNHGLAPAGDLWPYTLYKYTPETGVYSYAASVDSWQKDAFPEDYAGTPFPDDVDMDGDGIVYLVSTDSGEAWEPMDLADYLSWRESLLGNDAAMGFGYMDLTEENIALSST